MPSPSKIFRRILRHWRIFAVAVAIVAMLVPLVVVTIRSVEREAESRRIENGMHQIGIAIHNYYDVYRRFPQSVHRDKEGRALGSWRMSIEPFMAMGYLMPYAERWDDPENRWRFTTPHHDYCFREHLSDRRRLHTNVVAITGKGTFFDVGEFLPGMSTSNTIVAIEIAESGFHWMEPGDLSIDEVTPEIMKGLHGDGLHVLCADASVQFISADAPFDILKQFFIFEGSSKRDLQKSLGPYIR